IGLRVAITGHDMTDDESKIVKTWDDSNRRLAGLDGNNSEEAIMQRIAIYDAQCDMVMFLAKAARAEGKTEVANDFDSIANERWGRVVALTDDLENAPRDQMLKNFQSEHPDVYAL